MAQSPIRKVVEKLIKKVEALEDQGFAQKLLIDELEGKLARQEEELKQIKENPFGVVSVPFVQTPTIYPPPHTCTPGYADTTGGTNCTQCGKYMPNVYYAPPYTITCNSTADTTEGSILDIDITWVDPEKS